MQATILNYCPEFGVHYIDLKSRYLLVLDLDDGFYTFSQLEKELKSYECIIHTSYSHSEKCGKYRVYILFDKPVTMDIEQTCSLMLDYFKKILGDHIDEKCRNVSQVYFTPSCPPDAVELYRFKHIKGKPIRTANFKPPICDQNQIIQATKPSGHRPGDDYNRRGSWQDLLVDLGWSYFFTSNQGDAYWTRPGKTKSISAVVFRNSNVFYIHSSATEVAPFKVNKAYTLFAAYALIKHDNDFTAAAKQLKTDGYGDDGEVVEKHDDVAKNAAIKSFPAIKFPFDVFPDYFKKLVFAYSKALECHPSFMAMNFMTLLSGAAGNSVTVQVKKSWRVAPFIWFYVIAPTGEGKSHPIKEAMSPINKLQSVENTRFINEENLYKQKISAYQKEKKKGAGPPTEPTKIRHYYSSDFTIESLIPIFQVCSRGIVIHVDELAGLFNSWNQYKIKGSDIESMLSLFDGGQLKSDRKGANGFCNESGAAVIGGIQTARLSEVFNDKMHANGMVYRFLPMLLENSSDCEVDADLSEKNLNAWAKLLDWMYAIEAPVNPQDGCIIKQCLTMDDSARTEWNEFRINFNKLKKFMPERFREYIPKLTTFCLKFMSVLHLLKCYKQNKLTPTVKKSTVKSAIRLTHYFAGQALQLTINVPKKQNPYVDVINDALVALKDEFKGGKLLLKRVREKVNESLPSNLILAGTDNRLSTWIKAMGIEVESKGKNKCYVLLDGPNP